MIIEWHVYRFDTQPLRYDGIHGEGGVGEGDGITLFTKNLKEKDLTLKL